MGFLVYVLISVALSFAGALLTAYLASKQKGPPAEEFTPPDVTPGTPMTVLIGCKRVRPIITLMGPVTTQDVKEKTGAAFFGLIDIVQTVGKRYAITAQGVLCWGMVDALRNIVFDPNIPITDLPLASPRVDRFSVTPHFIGPPTIDIEISSVPRLTGTVDTFTRILHGGKENLELYCPTVLGGESNGGGGGVWGEIQFYVGSGQTGPSGVLESIVGVGNVPSYRELAYIVFNQTVVGTRPTMPPIDFIISAYPLPQLVSGLGSLGANVNTRTVHSRNLWAVLNLGPESDWQATDVCPIYAMLVVMLHPMIGLARDPEQIDLGQWNDTATTTNSEGIGVSVLLIGAKQAARDVLHEMLQVMDAVPRRHPETNKLQLKLVREEAYTSMRVFSPSEIIDIDVTRREWADTFNEVTVFFSNADRLYEEDFVTVRNTANIAATGSVRPMNPIRLPSVTYRPLAISIGLRELKAASLRLHTGTVKVTRAGFDMERGDVARFQVPWLDFTDDVGQLGELVLRVRAVNLGSPSSNVVTLAVVEDVFSHEDPATEVVDSPSGNEPVSSPPVVRTPTIIPMQRQDDTTGYLDLIIADPDNTVTKVEVSTSIGGATPSDWSTIAGPDYTASVPLDAWQPSTIAWRVTYTTGSTTETESGTVSFAPTANAVSTGTLDGTTNPIVWDTEGKAVDAKSVVIGGSRSLVIENAITGFRGTLTVTSTGGTGYTLTLPPGSIYGDGSSLNVTLGAKDQLSVYYDGTYFWWNLVTHATTLPPVPLAASLSADASLSAAFRDLSASLAATATTLGDIST